MASHKEVTIEEIPVIITKKKMKNMYIRIDEETGNIKVSVPHRVTYDDAEAFVRKNLDWVKSSREKFLKKKPQIPTQYCNGEKLLLWGEELEIEFVPSYSDKGVYVKDGRVVIYAPLESDASYRQALVDAWYRRELRDKIDSLKGKCCYIAGIEASEWRIKDMSSRWGTCNISKSRIWISLQLAKKPEICLFYVMLHELTHLYVPNHGAQFKAYMDKFCPDWREIRKMMNS